MKPGVRMEKLLLALTFGMYWPSAYEHRRRWARSKRGELEDQYWLPIEVYRI